MSFVIKVMQNRSILQIIETANKVIV